MPIMPNVYQQTPIQYPAPFVQQPNPFSQSQTIPNSQPDIGNGIIWVQGESGAKSYLVAAGRTVLLMDSEDSKFYIKSTDISGVPLPIRTFSYEELFSSPKTNEHESYVTRDEFNELKKMLDELTSPSA